MIRNRTDRNLRWLELTVTVGAGMVEEVRAVMGKCGHGGAVVEEWPDLVSGEQGFIVRAYLPYDRSLKRNKAALMQELGELYIPYPIRLQEQTLKPGEWFESWKKYFDAFQLGENFVIKPSWQDEKTVPAGKKVIELDPGMAFGTGLHATTKLSLINLEKRMTPGMSVLDVGTGTGILAIAAAKLGAGKVLALDTDSVAVSAARLNTVTNDAAGVVEVRKGTLSERRKREYRGYFDLVVANITASVIADLTASFLRVLKPAGILIACGINDQGLDEVLISFTIAGFKIEKIDSEGEWHAVVAAAPESK